MVGSESDPGAQQPSAGAGGSEAAPNAPEQGGTSNTAGTSASGGSASGGSASGGSAPGHCDCGISLPGITIEQDDGGLAIAVELPPLGSVVLRTPGNATTTTAGVHVQGDVAVDVGTGTSVALEDADLMIQVGKDGDLPTISGSADIAASLLGGLVGDQTDDMLHASVDVDTAVQLPGSSATIALGLGVKLPSVIVPGGELPSMPSALPLQLPELLLTTDGEHQLVKLWSNVDAGVAAWSPTIPVQATSALDALVTIADDQLLNVELNGDVVLLGNQLTSDSTSLLSVSIPKVKLTLDQKGFELRGKTNASIHPLLSVVGNAEITARFATDDWFVHLCAKAIVDLSSLGANAASCVDVTQEGTQGFEH